MSWAESVFIIEKLSNKIDELSIKIERIQHILQLIAEKEGIEKETSSTVDE